jgi:hypothetical protein
MMWIDLTSPDHVDAGPASLTEIGLGRGDRGAVYLISKGLSAMTMAAGKPGAR